MHFDDRLATVLRSPVSGAATARIQYRQLLDLLGTMPVETQGVQFDAACDRIGDLGTMIAPSDRAAMLREPGVRLRNPQLLALLAGGETAVAAAAIERAQLGEDEWIDLAPALPPAAGAMVRQRRDLGPRAISLFNRLGMTVPALPPGEAQVAIEAVPVAEAGAGKADNPSKIGAIVQRIEDFRKARAPVDASSGSGEAPHLPFGDAAFDRPTLLLRAFDFSTDSEGSIVWSDPGMAPMAVGLRLVSPEASAPPAARAALVLALRQHQPIRAMRIEIAGAPAIAGSWLIDATPSFDPLSGAYTGHSGRMRRPQLADLPKTAPEPDTDSDRVRQLLHELRTPVNAIQGFAEVIQQQLFGPAPHEYRALAAAIAGDAAHLLAGFEELERLARLEGGGVELPQGSCDLAAITAATVAQLQPFTEPRSSGFSIDMPDNAPLAVALGQDDTERLIWRLLATLAGAASPGEVLQLHGQQRRDTVELSMRLPAGLAAMDNNQLLHATAGAAPRAVMAGMFGTGFSLRLASAEAQAAGGNLQHLGNRLLLSLPGLTAALSGNSHEDGKRSAT
jgi:two-component system, OmpR family, sensor kinase